MLLRLLVRITTLMSVGAALPAIAQPPTLSCDEIGTAIGAPLTDMVPDPSSRPDWVDNPDRYQIVCSWVTKPAERMMRGALAELSAEELADAGQLSVEFSLHKNAADLERLRAAANPQPLPFHTDDPNLWAYSIEGRIDFEAPAAQMPPQIISGSLSTAISTTALLMQRPTSFTALTKGWTLEAGSRVISMARDKGL